MRVRPRSSFTCCTRGFRLAWLLLVGMMWLGPAVPAQATTFAFDLASATGFGSSGLGPEFFQVNGIKLDFPLSSGQVLSFTFDLKFKIDTDPSSPTFLHLIPAAITQTSGINISDPGSGNVATTSGTVVITVTNATTGSALSGATVTTEGGTTKTAGSDGTATFTGVRAGSPLQFTASASGFLSGSATVTPVANSTTSAAISLTPPVASGSFRVVLTWGDEPRDLDSHITGPAATGTSRFHILFNNKGSSTDTTLPSLDVDDTTSFGPETITVPSTAVRAGTYRYSVHQFAGSGTICTASSIQVKVYGDAGLLRTFTPPASTSTSFCGDKMVWTVFTIDGTTGEIAAVNTYTGPTDHGSVQ